MLPIFSSAPLLLFGSPGAQFAKTTDSPLDQTHPHVG
jgi:hypothetical protein